MGVVCGETMQGSKLFGEKKRRDGDSTRFGITAMLGTVLWKILQPLISLTSMIRSRLICSTVRWISTVSSRRMKKFRDLEFWKYTICGKDDRMIAPSLQHAVGQ